MDLFNRKADCCGCGACRVACPVGAISMEMDAGGALYPVIDQERCIECGRCQKVCGFAKPRKESQFEQKAYAAVAREQAVVERSSSGGAFATLAQAWIANDGVVYGCAMICGDDGLFPRHIRVDTQDGLRALQGSKYVQSDTGETYAEVKTDLKQGKSVLYSGTPCQIAGLYGFLGGEHENLVTIDLICHGVPGQGFFRSYIAALERKVHGKVNGFLFREKKNGWGLNGRIDYLDAKGKACSMPVYNKTSSYYNLFLEAQVYRESCYRCPYACLSRVADLTLGDYWGIEKEHPEYLSDHGGTLRKESGISCVLVNTAIGEAMLSRFGDGLELLPSEPERVARQNSQLRQPSVEGKNREEVLRIYRQQGYDGIEKWFRKWLGPKRYVFNLWYKLPKGLRKLIR